MADYDTTVQLVCDNFNIPFDILRAMSKVESGDNHCAIRYEPLFDKRYHRAPGGFIPRGCSKETEEVGRAMSWGPIQIMGETARAMGFEGWFPELCDPYIGLSWGAEYLKRMADKYPDEPWEVICRAYNGGPGNRHNLDNHYPDKIAEHLPSGWPAR